MKYLKHITRSLIRVIFLFTKNPTGSIKGILREIQAKYFGKLIVFKDEAGYYFYQYPNDNIFFNHQRKNVGDSASVRNYVLKNVQPGNTCIDLGACIGFISVPLWSCVGHKGLVISIEADPDNITILMDNISLNGYPNKYVINLAITDKNGTIKLRRYENNNGWQTIGNPAFASDFPNKLIEVETTSIDSVLKRYNFKSVDFIKIDVEGAELLVLEGMRSILKAGRVKQVLFEVNYLMLEGTRSSVQNLMMFWEGLPFSLYQVTADGERVLIDPSGLAPNYIGDCVALYRELSNNEF